MSSDSNKENKPLNQMSEQTLSNIDRKAERKIRYRRSRSSTLWFGLGTMGIVGWSVAIPALLGILIGLYLEENVSAPFSWVLTGLTLGIVLGCVNAWIWISRKQREIQQRREDNDEL